MRTKLTLSVDAETVDRAREAAKHQGTSLSALIRQYLDQLAGQWSRQEIARELARLWTEGGGHSDGDTLNREEAYEERIGRTRRR